MNPENQNIESNPNTTVDANLVQQKVDATLQQQPDEQKQSDIQEDPNWRAVREAQKKNKIAMEAAQRKAAEKEAEVEALKAAMEAVFAKQPMNNQQQQQNYNSQYQEEETEDQRIEKKVNAAMAVKEAQAERLRQEREQQEYPQRLAQTYGDFNQMISEDNLAYLDYHFPEVAGPLKRLPDDFNKWADIYRAVKKFVPNNLTSKKEAARADANFNKPKSMSSTGMSQDTQKPSSSLSNDKKQSNWARMQKTLKGLSS